MGDVIELFPSTEGADVRVLILKSVRAARGVKAAARFAQQMIVAASAVLAREAGPDQARGMLVTAGRVLPRKRRDR